MGGQALIEMPRVGLLPLTPPGSAFGLATLPVKGRDGISGTGHCSFSVEVAGDLG
jgi:hypothetical protein